MTLLLSPLKREITGISNPVVLDTPDYYEEVRNYGKVLFIQGIAKNGWWEGMHPPWIRPCTSVDVLSNKIYLND